VWDKKMCGIFDDVKATFLNNIKITCHILFENVDPILISNYRQILARVCWPEHFSAAGAA
jgi:hypothetical protein